MSSSTDESLLKTAWRAFRQASAAQRDARSLNKRQEAFVHLENAKSSLNAAFSIAPESEVPAREKALIEAGQNTCCCCASSAAVAWCELTWGDAT
jgi:hypothetical protein